MKKVRHNSLERKGVNRLEFAVIEELGWIFREQSVVDVGIDALVEKCVDGNPEGKFLAIQLKSGLSHFYESANKRTLTYYLSEVHYYYWTNLNLPIILVGFNDENNRLFWKEISKQTVQKSEKRKEGSGWKLIIDKNSILDRKALPKLNRLVKHKQGLIPAIANDETIFDYADSMNTKLVYARQSMEYVTQFLMDFKGHVENRNVLLNELAASGRSLDSLEVQSSLKSYATLLEVYGLRISQENTFFARFLSDVVLSVKEIAPINIDLRGEDGIDDVKLFIDNSIGIIPSFDEALLGFENLQRGINSLPELEVPGFFIDAKYTIANAIDGVVDSFKDGRSIWSKLITDLRKLTGSSQTEKSKMKPD